MIYRQNAACRDQDHQRVGQQSALPAGTKNSDFAFRGADVAAMRAHARQLPSMMEPKKAELTAADEQHPSTHGDNTLQLRVGTDTDEG